VRLQRPRDCGIDGSGRNRALRDVRPLKGVPESVIFVFRHRITVYAADERLPRRLVTSAMSTGETEFLDLLEQHKAILFKIANLYCRNRADFADVVQEITLQAWRAFNRYDRARPFSTWLYRVGLNVAISFYRTESRRSRFTVSADESIVEIAGPPSDAAELNEQLRLLHRLINQFGELDKAVVLLYMDGHHHDTIAEILGISKSNVGTRINRTKQKLRQKRPHLSSREYSHGL
jgi:RNA polymerase sigma factor (sigma-70 family)